jgi:hypothetical protein
MSLILSINIVRIKINASCDMLHQLRSIILLVLIAIVSCISIRGVAAGHNNPGA